MQDQSGMVRSVTEQEARHKQTRQKEIVLPSLARQEVHLKTIAWQQVRLKALEPIPLAKAMLLELVQALSVHG